MLKIKNNNIKYTGCFVSCGTEDSHCCHGVPAKNVAGLSRKRESFVVTGQPYHSLSSFKHTPISEFLWYNSILNLKRKISKGS